MKVVGTTDIRRLHVRLLLVRLGGESDMARVYARSGWTRRVKMAMLRI
jgi:hypothetical protein